MAETNQMDVVKATWRRQGAELLRHRAIEAQRNCDAYKSLKAAGLAQLAAHSTAAWTAALEAFERAWENAGK